MARYGDEFYGLSPYGTDTLVDFDVSPFIVSSIDYNKIFVQWNTPTGDWDVLRLVRNGFGFPMTPDDGDLLFEGSPSSDVRTYLDEGQVPNNSGLIEGRTYYYTIFVRQTTNNRWITAGTNLGVAVKNYGTADLMYEYLPTVYKLKNPYSALDNEDTINEDLFNFLQIFAFEHDLFKTTTANMKNRYDPLTLDGRLIPLLLNQFGFAFEKEIGLQQARSLLKNAIKIYSERGSLSGLKTFVTAFTGFNCDISEPVNLMLDYNNSSFKESLGFWQSIENTTLFRATATSETPSIDPYSEPTSPSNFPNAAFGFLRTTANTAADMLIECGTSNPLTRGIPVNPGTVYNLTCFTRAKTTARTVTLNIKWYDRFGQFIGAAGEASYTNNTTAWTRSTASSGSAPENARFAVPQIRIEGSVQAEVHYIDAVQFSVGSEPQLFSDARRVDVVLRANRINQVINPSFEGGLANWYFEGGTVELATEGAVENSTYSAKITAAIDNDIVSAFSLEQVAVQGGDQNAFSAYVKGTPGSKARLSLVWYDQSGTVLEQYSTADVPLTLGSWTRLEATEVSPENAVTASLEINFTPDAIGDLLYLDAVLFEKAAFVVPYFDGGAGYAQLGDVIWENGDPLNGRSHYYKNRQVVTKRLLETLPDYLPIGSPWAVFVAQPD